MILKPPCSVRSASHATSSPSKPSHIGLWPHPAFGNQLPMPYGMPAAWLNEEEECCLGAAKRSYLTGGNLPLGWPNWRSGRVGTSIQDTLEYLLHLQESGLVLSSLRVHLAAMLAFHPSIQGKFIFFKCHRDEISERTSLCAPSSLSASLRMAHEHGFSSSNRASVQAPCFLPTAPPVS